MERDPMERDPKLRSPQQRRGSDTRFRRAASLLHGNDPTRCC
jgi:hypothetical protein